MYKTLKMIENKNGDKNEKKVINCFVYECEFCNRDDEKCELNEIKVANQSEAKSKKGTMCASFKKRV